MPQETEGKCRFAAAAPWIYTSDPKQAIRYYRDVLGFDGEWHWVWGDPSDHAGLSRDDVRILLVRSPERSQRMRGAELVIIPEKVEASFQEHSASGARIAQSPGRRPWGTLDYCVEVPGGYRLVFTEALEEPSQPTPKPKASDDR